MKANQWLKKPFGRVKGTLLAFARSGLSRKKLTLCVAMGLVLSIFPVMGTTTVLCAIAALVLRLNFPLIQVVNYAAYPLQILLLLPFYTAGSWLFGGHLPTEAVAQLIAALQSDPWNGVRQLRDLILYAVFVWLLVSPVLVLLLYGLLMPVIDRVQSALQRKQSDRKISKNPTQGLVQ